MSEEQKLEEFGSDFPAMLRWFKSSQLDFKSAISWLGTVSNFRCLGVKFIKFEYVWEVGPIFFSIEV